MPLSLVRPSAGLWILVLAAAVPGAEPGRFASHPPPRPLPVPSERPLAKGPALFVDPARGDDHQDGSQDRPWKTLGHAAGRLKPGDTLYLRGGTYYEHVALSCAGTADRPITVRSYPKELAVLDGGLREFYETPETAWEPYPDGAEGEYRSTRTYSDLGGSPGQTNVLGRFGDSMVPLQGYRFFSDLRSTNPYWNIENKTGEDKKGVYCGPGLLYDVTTGRIHARLAHSTLPGLGADGYRGETDPRKLRLVVGGHRGGPTLALRDCRHVRLQDLVVRGSRLAAVEVTDGVDLELDGLTLYGGSSALTVRDTAGLRLYHTACRGLAAPWTFRDSLKYRAIESRIVSGGGWEPTGKDSRDFELAYCEFTDSVDGVFVGNVRGVRFHHNLLDNVSDDGLFLTAATAYDGSTPGGDVRVYQNLLRRCLTTFAFGVGHGRQKATPAGRQTGSGVHIYRNILDYRRPVMYYHPSGPDAPQDLSSKGRFASDHGSPAWEPLFVYHNTVIADDPPRYAYGTAGLGNGIAAGTKRRVFNNVVVNVHHLPGNVLPPATADLQADGNLFWSLSRGAEVRGDFFAKFRASKDYAASKQRYTPGWTAHDRFADPKFVRVDASETGPLDLRLQKDSPAIDGGVPVPADWPDPLRSDDAAAPDVGAIPLGASPWHVGVRGRLTVFGEERAPQTVPVVRPAEFPVPPEPPPARKPAALVQGYPAFDAPLVAFALRRAGARVNVYERSWLDPREYGKYGLVAIVGDLARGKVEPRQYGKDHLAHVRRFLDEGGTLLLQRGGADVFATPEGRAFLDEITGTGPVERQPTLELRQPDHPWVRHLDPKGEPPWLAKRGATRPLRTTRGEQIIASKAGAAILYRVPVGRGQLVYIGWEIAESIPHGRKPSTVAQEQLFEEQVKILLNLVGETCPRAPAGGASR